MKKLKCVLFICVLLLSACYTNEAGYEPIGEFGSNQYTYEIATKVFKDGVENLRLVNFFHGEGKPGSKIFLKDNQQVFNRIDSVFYLPFNINSDTSVFCFERNDLKRDTIWLGYNRLMSTGWSHEVYTALRGIKIIKCSSGILIDSCLVSERNDLKRGTYIDLAVSLKLELK